MISSCFQCHNVLLHCTPSPKESLQLYWNLVSPQSANATWFPLSYVFFPGPYPSESAKTKAVFPLSNGTSSSDWGAQLVSNRNNVLNISILSPANAPIGRYTLNMQISSQGSDSMLKLGTFILLFNPWLQGRHPTTHTPSHQLRDVHGKEMEGMVFMGSGLIRGRLWNKERAQKLEVRSQGFWSSSASEPAT